MRLLLVLWSLGSAAAQEVRITVRVVYPEAVPQATRQAGELLAARVLAKAGVAVDWVECPCSGQPAGAEFRVQLLSHEPPRNLTDATGFSVIYPTESGTDGYAAIFYRRVVEVAGQEGVPDADVLGLAMAHEIGHLLLGARSHGRCGVMQPRFRRQELQAASRGELRFTAEEAARMVAAVRRRR